MDLTGQNWQTISKLLDRALDLSPEQRKSWVDTLGPPDSAFRETLRELLARHAEAETADFLNTLPKLTGTAAFGAGAPLSEVAAQGAVVGQYRIIRELGRGGMGAVFLAERADGLLKRPVALKLPHSGVSDARLVERFAREREILAGLNHPNIARLYDAGVTESGQPYLALEYVAGTSLSEYCDRHQLDIAHRLQLFLQVLGAVQYAHAHLVVHRDLKPSNVLVTADGQVRLLDFGIAKLLADGEARETELTQVGGRALTPDYASPEQIAGLPIGTASDVYSLGVLLYELLAGERPYKLKRDSRGALEDAILAAEPARPSALTVNEAKATVRATTSKKLSRVLRGDLDTIVLRALKKNPEERYITAEAFAQDLRRYLVGDPVLARPDSASYRIGKFMARNRVAAGASLAVSIALIAATVVSVSQAKNAQREANRAIAVQRFLTDIFRANSDTHPDPGKARQTTARELLDIGASRIDENFKSDPEGKAEILDMLGEMYFDVGLDPEAADFYRRKVDALKKAFGERDPRVAEALVDYGDQLQGLDRREEQLRALDEAKRILDTNRDFTSEQRAQLLKALARANYSSGAKGLKLAEEALQIYRRYHPDGQGLQGVLTQVGYSRMWVGDTDGAEACFSEELSLFDNDPNASVSGTITALLGIAEAQARQEKIADAERNYRLALEKTNARNGPQHEDTLHVEARFGLFLHETSRRPEGRRWLRSALEKMNQGNYTPNVINAVKRRVAYSLLAEGRLAEAEPMWTNIVEDDRKFTGAESTVLVSDLRAQAELWLAQGRFADAQTAIATALSMLKNVLGPGGDPAMANAPLLTRAQLELAQGDAGAAIRTLDEIKPPRNAERLPIRLYEIRALGLRAAAALRLQQIETAGHAAQQAIDQIAKSGLRDYYQSLEAEALLRLGQATQRGTNPGLAREQLERALRLRQANEDAVSPYLAEAEIALADCLLDLGDRKAASALVKSANARLAANPRIGEHFQASLRDVSMRLAIRQVAPRISMSPAQM